MVRLELTPEEARRLREVLQAKLRDLSTEINRTDQLDFKESLRRTERVLDRVVAQLASTAELAM